MPLAPAGGSSRLRAPLREHGCFAAALASCRAGSDVARARLEQAGKQRAGSGRAGPPRNGDGADRIARRRQGTRREGATVGAPTARDASPLPPQKRIRPGTRRAPGAASGSSLVIRRPRSSDHAGSSTADLEQAPRRLEVEGGRGNQVEMRAASTSVSVRDGTVKPGTRKHRHARSRRLEALRRPDLEARRGARSDATGTACVVSHRPASARSRLNHRSLAQKLGKARSRVAVRDAPKGACHERPW